ncbi:MAG: protein-L-isoaspartate(D-aspartate) O-methyltransferase [Anaerolineae bacterium]|nr:protein-L-isoaspartate(D-aspartate) O-methyltransferase [Anaerolineae bacterium]
MVKVIRRRGITDSLILDAMANVPRDRFVPEQQRGRAFGDHALPIGHQQTISQPYMVALMTQALALKPGDRVLEIGTGSGYQAAILAEMGMEVYTVERIEALYATAKKLYHDLGYIIQQKWGDGYYGWPEYAPYTGIIVTAAATYIPDPLFDQLAEGGRLVAPVGPAGGYQTLWKYTKHGETVDKENLGGVIFVPFITDSTPGHDG